MMMKRITKWAGTVIKGVYNKSSDNHILWSNAGFELRGCSLDYSFCYLGL